MMKILAAVLFWWTFVRQVISLLTLLQLELFEPTGSCPV